MEQLETKLKVSNISKTFFNKKDYFTIMNENMALLRISLDN